MIAGRGWAKRILEVQWATRRVLAWHAVFGRCSCRAAQVLDVQRAAACAISAETRSLRVDGQGARVLSWARERQGVCARQGAHRPSIDRVKASTRREPQLYVLQAKYKKWQPKMLAGTYDGQAQ